VTLIFPGAPKSGSQSRHSICQIADVRRDAAARLKLGSFLLPTSNSGLTLGNNSRKILYSPKKTRGGRPFETSRDRNFFARRGPNKNGPYLDRRTFSRTSRKRRRSEEELEEPLTGSDRNENVISRNRVRAAARALSESAGHQMRRRTGANLAAGDTRERCRNNLPVGLSARIIASQLTSPSAGATAR